VGGMEKPNALCWGYKKSKEMRTGGVGVQKGTGKRSGMGVNEWGLANCINGRGLSCGKIKKKGERRNFKRGEIKERGKIIWLWWVGVGGGAELKRIGELWKVTHTTYWRKNHCGGRKSAEYPPEKAIQKDYEL